MPESSRNRCEAFVSLHIGNAVRRKLQAKQEVSLTAHGQSMFPFIQQGDRCTFIAQEPDQYTRGDVILYQDQSGKLIAHRLLAKKTDALDHPFLIVKGDTNLNADPPVHSDQIIGVLTHVAPSRRIIRISHLYYRTWCHLVLHISYISWFLHKYLAVRNRISKMLRT